MALQVFKCGTLHGPDGIGKIETIRDISEVTIHIKQTNIRADRNKETELYVRMI
jgi:hypothetical protein